MDEPALARPLRPASKRCRNEHTFCYAEHSYANASRSAGGPPPHRPRSGEVKRVDPDTDHGVVPAFATGKLRRRPVHRDRLRSPRRGVGRNREGVCSCTHHGGLPGYRSRSTRGPGLPRRAGMGCTPGRCHDKPSAPGARGSIGPRSLSRDQDGPIGGGAVVGGGERDHQDRAGRARHRGRHARHGSRSRARRAARQGPRAAPRRHFSR